MLKKEIRDIELENKKYVVIINRKKIKNTYIRVNLSKEIIINTNHLVPLKVLYDLIIKNQNKLLKSLSSPLTSLSNNQIAYLGRVYELIIEKSTNFAYKIEHDRIIIEVREKYDPIDYFYKAEAERILGERYRCCFSIFKKTYDVFPPSLHVRRMLKRYGTCYYKRNSIILNQSLVKTEIGFIDYVIFHELTHLIVPNHSKEFYKVLKTFVPNLESYRK